MNAYNNPNADGYWSFTVGTNSNGDVGYWKSSVSVGSWESTDYSNGVETSNLNYVVGRSLFVPGNGQKAGILDDLFKKASTGVWQLGVSLDIVAGVGGTIEGGATFDFNGGFHIKPYLTLSQGWGVDLGLGLKLTCNTSNTQHNLTVNDLKGWGEGYGGNIGDIGVGKGGNSEIPGLDPNNYMDYHSQYDNYSLEWTPTYLPFGYARTKGFTWVYF